MPPKNYLQSDYFGAMDRPSYFQTLDEQAPVYHETPHNASAGLDSDLTPHELGTTLNPMQHQLQALQAKIKEGASKVEFEFLGQGKGNSQQATPESYGKEEREMMRKLAQINKIKSSTHATPSVSGLAGFGERGFDKRRQQQTIKEVQRAIDFAKDATTGGAVVVHTGEWERPVSPNYGKDGRREQAGFSAYEGEDQEAQMLVVDEETGQFITGISKKREIDVPKWKRAGEERWGEDLHGNRVKIKPDDFVDIEGRKIDPTKPNELFRRVPDFYEDETGEVRFETDRLKWSDLEKETRELQEKYGIDITPEEYYAQLQIDNQILQAKGQSLFHLQKYRHDKETFKEAKKAYEYYKELDERLPEDEKWRLMKQVGGLDGITPPKNKSIPEILKERMEQAELSMRHTHQSSSAADTQAAEAERRRENITTMKEYGLKQTGQALARLADEAMTKSQEARKMRNADEEWEDLYIAPENWHPGQYGSHPEELLEIVKAGREEFKKKLEKRHKIHDKDKQEELAKKHIKTTFDIGHLNMWRSMMEKNPNESDEEFQQRFTGWVKKHLDKLHEEEAIGHLHLTDNFGYDDEHLSLGQGNAPVKEFVDWMQERGYTDFIIEPGSFNAQTIMPDAWSYLGASPQRRFGPSGGFQGTRMAHAGLYQNPNYIVGSYVPSNEWTLWTGVPLE